MAPQKWLCAARPPQPPAPRKATPSERGCCVSDLSRANGAERGGRVPRAIGTVMVTDTLGHHRGLGSGDPAPAQPRREHVPRAFGRPMTGVPWEGTSPPVPGGGRGKDLHAGPAVGKPQLSSAQPQLIPAEPGPGTGRGGGPRAPRIPPHTGLGGGEIFFFLGK